MSGDERKKRRPSFTADNPPTTAASGFGGLGAMPSSATTTATNEAASNRYTGVTPRCAIA
jgi:hypothetical protein